jgi:hypothetical protein
MVAIPTEMTALQLLATYKLGLSTSLKYTLYNFCDNINNDVNKKL